MARSKFARERKDVRDSDNGPPLDLERPRVRSAHLDARGEVEVTFQTFEQPPRGARRGVLAGAGFHEHRNELLRALADRLVDHEREHPELAGVPSFVGFDAFELLLAEPEPLADGAGAHPAKLARLLEHEP
jgi:hypothetical protein